MFLRQDLPANPPVRSSEVKQKVLKPSWGLSGSRPSALLRRWWRPCPALAEAEGGAFVSGLSRSLEQAGRCFLHGELSQGCGRCVLVPQGGSGEVP